MKIPRAKAQNAKRKAEALGNFADVPALSEQLQELEKLEYQMRIKHYNTESLKKAWARVERYAPTSRAETRWQAALLSGDWQAAVTVLQSWPLPKADEVDNPRTITDIAQRVKMDTIGVLVFLGTPGRSRRALSEQSGLPQRSPAQGDVA